VKLVDQDVSWELQILCKPCVEHLGQWMNNVRKSLKFAVSRGRCWSGVSG